MLEAALRHNGFDVESAVNGRNALSVVSEARSGVIVLDVMMQSATGSRCAAGCVPRAPVLC